MNMADQANKAVALRYDTRLPAPFVTATGRGEQARRLVALARRYGIAVQSAPDLAEHLVYFEPGQVIPEEFYMPVARILAFVLDLEDRRRTDGRNEENPRT